MNHMFKNGRKIQLKGKNKNTLIQIMNLSILNSFNKNHF